MCSIASSRNNLIRTNVVIFVFGICSNADSKGIVHIHGHANIKNNTGVGLSFNVEIGINDVIW